MKSVKISQILIVFFIIVGVISSLIGGTIYYYAGINVIEQNVADNVLSVSESRSDHIETYLKQNIERLKLVTSRTKLRETLHSYNVNPSDDKLETMTKIIVDAKDSVKEIKRICVLDLTGTIIASTSEEFCGIDMGNEDVFLSGKEGESILLKKDNGDLSIFVTGPFIYQGELIGVGITVVETFSLESIVKERTGLGETGEVLVAITEGEDINFIFERRFESEALTDLPSDIYVAEPMKEALLGNELVFENSLDYRGELVFASSQYIDLANLGLVTKIDSKEFVGKYQEELLQNSIYVSVLIIILSLLLGLFLSKFLSYSINGITNKIVEISKGNLNIKLPESKIEEINKLNNSLSRILSSLKITILRTGATTEELGLGEAIKAKKRAEQIAKKRASQIERFAKLAIGREERMIELKRELSQLRGKDNFRKNNVLNKNNGKKKKTKEKSGKKTRKGNRKGSVRKRK